MHEHTDEGVEEKGQDFLRALYIISQLLNKTTHMAKQM